MLIESGLYERLVAPYFRLGPVWYRERWHCPAPIAAVRTAIRAAMPLPGLAARFDHDLLRVRRPMWALSSFPRFVVRVVPDGEHTTLIYEVKPFLASMIAVPLAAVAVVVRFGGQSLLMYLAFGVFVVLMYLLVPVEHRRMRRLPALRAALAGLGLRVCQRCGYDLHASPPGPRCPECGAHQPAPPGDEPADTPH